MRAGITAPSAAHSAALEESVSIATGMDLDLGAGRAAAASSIARITWRWTVATVLAVSMSLPSGCDNGEVPGAGASRMATPPFDLTQPVEPTVDVSAPAVSAAAPNPAALKLIELQNSLNRALANENRPTTQAVVTQPEAAGGQILVTWVTNTGWYDGARNAVRADALTILDEVRKTGLSYTWLLLIATGGTVVEGKKKQTVVVRAKYSHGLVERTDWTSVPTNRVFQLPDDKPAVIDTQYR
jgi:hypothetical protein